MRSAVIIKKEVIYLNQDGKQIFPSFEERALDIISNRNTMIFAEIYSKVGKVFAKTVKELEAKIWEFAEKNNLGYDFEIFTAKK